MSRREESVSETRCQECTVTALCQQALLSCSAILGSITVFEQEQINLSNLAVPPYQKPSDPLNDEALDFNSLQLCMTCASPPSHLNDCRPYGGCQPTRELGESLRDGPRRPDAFDRYPLPVARGVNNVHTHLGGSWQVEGKSAILVCAPLSAAHVRRKAL